MPLAGGLYRVTDCASLRSLANKTRSLSDSKRVRTASCERCRSSYRQLYNLRCQVSLQLAIKRLIERYLNAVVVVSRSIFSYDQAAAEWHAAERAWLTALGKTPPFADGQIIAIGHANSLILVTLDPSVYAAFGEVNVKNWSR